MPSLPTRRPPPLGHAAALLALSLIVSACVTVPRDAGQPTVEPSAAATPAASRGPVSDISPSTTADASSAEPSAAASATASPVASPTPVPRSAEPSIGYLTVDASTSFVRAITGGLRTAAAEAGVDLVECAAVPTRNGVMSCATELAQAGVHGLISLQPFTDLSEDICAMTGDAPTIGIIYDQGPCQVSLLEIDHFESGRIAGEAMGQLAADRWGCDVRAFVSLESGTGDPVGRARMDGYREGYREHCDLPKEVVALSNAQHLVTARTQMATLLERLKGKPILVAGVSDIAILGAMQAASDAGREKQLWYSGQLADPAIRDEIACDERYIASVAQFPERFGSVLVPDLVDAIAGRDVPGRIEAELQLVTSTNVRQLFPDTPVCGE